MRKYTGLEIAVIGMSGSFSGAEDLNEFWDNIKNGVESIQALSDEELLEEGENKSMLDNPLYVKASSYLKNKEYFDSAFFNYRPDEAKLMDPQMRIFHECVWKALEDAGCNTFKYKGKIGLFAGGSSNINWEIYSSLANKDGLVDSFSAMLFRSVEFINTRMSYLLNLRGPSIFLATACSTSLVSVQQACKSLLTAECNMAIAGGVTIKNSSKKGYLYNEGGINSKDGHCRTFDEKANGTVIGEGVGVVVLKTLKNAIKDGDNILGVIIGSGINNDGSNRVGYTAPGVEGQTESIMMAHKWANIEPESISYVETHGTATELGDPIEIEALSRAFGNSKLKYCALGSVKPNIGHADSASGVASLIKTILALKHKQIPPSINFKSPNPKINFVDTPFYVNTELKEWKNDKYPLRAGVSSFGIGGTNAHVLVEEAPVQDSSSESRNYHILAFSAKTPSALQRNIKNFTEYLKNNQEVGLPDIAYTLQMGRVPFAYRKMIVCKEKEEAIDILSTINKTNKLEPLPDKISKDVVFMFSGQGSQYIDMCYGLYKNENIFKKEVDKCLELIKQFSGKDLKPVIFKDPEQNNSNNINNTEFTQPALFIIEYALARLLMHWGVNPKLMIGHSIGEYVAACISGVFTLEDALILVTKRGELMQKVPKGTMLSISITKSKLQSILNNYPDISLAAVNSSELCVVSGTEESIKSFKPVLEKDGYVSTEIHTSHAFHSYMMDEILDEFEKEVCSIKINKQQIPFISNLTGKHANDNEISNPQYWVRHLRESVKFSDGIETILINKNALFIEVGPGNVLGTFVRSNKLREKGHKVVSLVSHPKDNVDDLKYLLTGLGDIWLNGIEPEWNNFYENEVRRKVSLPTYSFDKIKYPTIVNATKIISELVSSNSKINSNELSNWFYNPIWGVSNIANSETTSIEKKCNIIFADNCGISNKLQAKLEQEGEKTIIVEKGKAFEKKNDSTFEINSELEEDYIKLFKTIGNKDSYRIIFAWGISDDTNKELTINKLRDSLNESYYSLLNIVKTIGSSKEKADIEIVAITNDLHSVLKTDQISPEKSPLLGAIKVIPKEYINIKKCKNIDIILSEEDDELIENLFIEIKTATQNNSVAYRNRTRFVEEIKQIKLPKQDEASFSFVSGEAYLITGGIGGMGLSITKKVTESCKGVNFILLGRKELPQKSEWKNWLSNQNKENPLFNVISELQLIEENGGHIHYYKVDIIEKEKLKKVIFDAEEKLGRIRGVIHTAGVADYGGIIHRRTKEDDESIFAAKLYGTIILNDILSENQLDFFVLCSSVSSVYAPFGEVGYVSANIFLDFFSKYNSNIKGRNTISIGWNNWKEVGMGIKAAGNNANHKAPADSISPEEGYEILLRCLKSKRSEILISKMKLSELEDLKNKEALPKEETLDIETNEEIDNITSITSIEKSLLTLWQNFFGKTDINIDDDFFEIGGDSLKALTLIKQIHKALNIELSIIDIFNNSSIRKLCEYISSIKTGSKEIKKYVAISKVDIKEYYLLSSAQKRLYFLYEYDKTSLAYNMPQVVKLEGDIDKEKLNNAFNKLIARHESLRTSFELVNGQVAQKISDQVNFEIEYFNSDEKEIAAIIKDFVRPFDLATAPLIKVGIIETIEHEHILMVDTHHIVTDGVSHGIMIKEFMAFYNNENLPEIELQYKDYAEWQQSEAQLKEMSKQKAFWLNEFADEVTSIDLPSDFKRPSIKNYDGNTKSFIISTEETAKLKSIAEKEGATLFMVLLSIYSILLSKLSNHEDIVIGTPLAGRGHTDLESMIGMFVNTLPLRNYPKGNLSFSEFLSEVKQRNLACFDNQTYQYEELIDELNLVRDTSRNPLFDVLFVFQNYESKDLEIKGLTLKPYNRGNATSKFDLSLIATESHEQIISVFEYSTALFSKETIEKFISYFRKIVSDISIDQSKKISEIKILSEKEKKQLLYDFNDTKSNYPNDKTIHKLLEEQVKRTPDKVALEFDGKEITYQELNQKSNQLANLLVEKGVQVEDTVAIMIDRSFEMIIGIFGIIKSGGACLPIDPEYPEERIRDIIELSKTKVLLCNLDHGISEIETIRIDQNIEKHNNTNLDLDIRSNNLIYIIYTSGSTGKPKGVMLEHNNMVNLIHWGKEHTNIIYNKVLQFATLSFDMSFHEIFSALLNGGTLYLISEKLRMDVVKLFKHITEKEITTMWLPTAFLKYMLNSDEFTEFLPTSVKHIVTAGEQLVVSDYLRDYLRKNKICLYNFYGPSETHVVTALTMNYDEQISDIPSIGIPISNTSCFIVDNNMQLNALGIEGELLIGGEQVGRGYLFREDLTKEKFIYWDSETGKTYNEENKSEIAILVYRTGDTCRWLPDGNIEFLGRKDHQVKIRGFRIELGEIETIILKHEKVKETTVIARDEKNEKNLCAYIVSDDEFDISELRAYLSSCLPDYMIPSYFVSLENLPLTLNGKINIRALPEPDIKGGNDYIPPSNEIEEKLVKIWSGILKIDEKEISIDRNFFELGGHSLRAMTLVNILQKDFETNITLKDLFNKQTIESLAEYIMTLKQLDDTINENDTIKEVII